MLLVFELTYMCPFKCPHCWIRKRSEHIVSLEKFEDVIRCFRDNVSGKLKLVISGGEPSLIRNLSDYVGIAKGYGYIVTVATAVYNEDVLERARPDWYQVSIDFYGERHDNWRGYKGLFSKAINFALRHDNAFVRSVAMKTNIEDLIRIKETIGDKLMLVLPIKGCRELEPTPEQLNVLRKHGIIVGNTCPAGRKLIAITPELDIIPCIFYRKKLGKYRTCRDLVEALELGAKIKPFPCRSVS